MEEKNYLVKIQFEVTGDEDSMPDSATLQKDFRIWIEMWGDKVPLDVSEAEVLVTIA